jgi:hypothetical protein
MHIFLKVASAIKKEFLKAAKHNKTGFGKLLGMKFSIK